MSYAVLSIEKSKELSTCKSFKEQSDWLNENYTSLEVYKVMYATYPKETRIMYYATDYTRDMLAQELKLEESSLIRMKYV